MMGRTCGTGKGAKALTRRVCAALSALAVMAAGAGGARADTAYGCGDLLTSSLVPSVEGADGTFFRVDPDLMSYHWIGAQSMTLLGQLSDRLAEHGTQLIYVPVPTKALAMLGHLPAIAADLGFDAEIAASVYVEMLDRLDRAGVRAIDARTVLRMAEETGHMPFFGTDPRLTPAGTEALGRAIAAELRQLGVSDADGAAGFRVQSRGEVDLPSPLRTKLQTHCLSDLPPVRLPVLETTRGVVAASATLDGAVAQPPVVIVGSEIAVDPALALSGFASAYARVETAGIMVPGEDRHEDAFGAISSYMSSAAFDIDPPKVLVWVNPVWLHLDRRGSRPLLELIALAGRRCVTDLSTSPIDGGGLTASLTGDLPRGVSHAALLLDSGGPAIGRVEFRFTSADGETRRRIVERHPDQEPTARVAMPLAGMWPEGAMRIDILGDVPLTARPRLSLCEEI